jgi:hypothetical protein
VEDPERDTGRAFESAREIVNGAGLLVRDGAPMSGWQATENLVPGTFTDVRHPRTLIGLDRKGALWLARSTAVSRITASA